MVGATASEDDETLKRMTDKAMGVVMRSEDLAEGLTAFIEKRAPGVEGPLTRGPVPMAILGCVGSRVTRLVRTGARQSRRRDR